MCLKVDIWPQTRELIVKIRQRTRLTYVAIVALAIEKMAHEYGIEIPKSDDSGGQDAAQTAA